MSLSQPPPPPSRSTRSSRDRATGSLTSDRCSVRPLLAPLGARRVIRFPSADPSERRRSRARRTTTSSTLKSTAGDYPGLPGRGCFCTPILFLNYFSHAAIATRISFVLTIVVSVWFFFSLQPERSSRIEMPNTTIEDDAIALKSYVKSYPDFPLPGILFR